MNIKELSKEADWLIYKYNELLQDDAIKDKNEVREWFNCMIHPLIINGVPSFKFLYCEATLAPIEELKKLYRITDEIDAKYRKKYSNLEWFEMIKKYNKDEQ